MAQAKSKDKEGLVLMRSGEKIELKKADNQFTTLFQKGVDLTQKPSLKKALKRAELVGNVTLFKVDSGQRDPVMDAIRKDKDSVFCHHVYQAVEDTESHYVLTDEIIVQFKENISTKRITELIEKYHLEIIHEYSDHANNFILRVTPDSGANPIKISNRLYAEGVTEYAEPNIIVQYQKFFEPDDEFFREQWHLKNQGGVELVPGADVSAPEAWNITTGSRSIIVAVIDDGFDLDHPDLQGDGKIVAPIDFRFRIPPDFFNPNPEVISDREPLPEGNDYHGTPCAGVAVAEIGEGKVVGVAPDCALMPIRWPFQSTDSMTAAMFTHAYLSGAGVISCSWGPGKGINPISSKFSQVLHDAATKGRGGKGCLIFFAAGNDNVPIKDTINDQRHFNGECAHPDVIAVAACTSLNKKAAYSGWGHEISVCAPSNNFWPGDVSRKLPGRGIVTTDNGEHGSGFSQGLYTSQFGGTSSATPLAAGVAALIISANPSLTAAQVREILESTADKIEDHDPDPQLGFAKGTYDDRGHSEWFGFGKVNAAAAVRKAREIDNIIPRSIRVEQVVDTPIPDAEPAGIISRFTISERGRIQQILVTVDIKHTYIGDLIVNLVAPDGKRITLHNRDGGGTNDLQSVFDQNNTVELDQLVGVEIQGVWSLEVSDNARIDQGTLRQWALEAEVEGDGSIRVESRPSLRIPDNNIAGISDTLIVGTAQSISQLTVEVDITHTWISDLKVVLTGASGQKAVLHNRTGGDAHNIQREYSVSNAPEIQKFLNQPARGQWTLTVSDHANRDIGKLNQWAIRII